MLCFGSRPYENAAVKYCLFIYIYKDSKTFGSHSFFLSHISRYLALSKVSLCVLNSITSVIDYKFIKGVNIFLPISWWKSTLQHMLNMDKDIVHSVRIFTECLAFVNKNE